MLSFLRFLVILSEKNIAYQIQTELPFTHRRKLIVGTSRCIIDREHWTIGGRCSARYVIFSFLQLSSLRIYCHFLRFLPLFCFFLPSLPPSLSPSLSLFLFLCLSASSITIKIFLTHGLSRPNSTFLFRGFLRCQSR